MHVSKVFRKYWHFKQTRRRTHYKFLERFNASVVSHYETKLKEYQDNYSETQLQKRFILVHLHDTSSQLISSLYHLYDENVHLGFILPKEDPYFKSQVQLILQTSLLNDAEQSVSRISFFHLDEKIECYQKRIHHDLKVVSSTKLIQQLKNHMNAGFGTNFYLDCTKVNNYNMELAWVS